MAKREHLKILGQGVDVWNKWRKENLEIKPDLRRADLSEADLGGADLRGSNLKETELDGALLDNAIYDVTTIFSAALNQKKLDKMGMILSKES